MTEQWRSRAVGLGLLLVATITACSSSGPPVTAGSLGADGIASTSSPLALSPDGSTLWVVNPDADSVTAIDSKSLVAQDPLPVGREPWSVAVTPGGTVVVMNRGGGSLSVIGPESGSNREIVVGPEPGGLALSPSGRYAYVTLSASGHLAIVDLTDIVVIERIPIGPMPWAVAVTDDGDGLDSDEHVIVAHRLARLREGSSGSSSGSSSEASGESSDAGKEGWLTVLPVTSGYSRTIREYVIDPFPFGYPNTFEGLAVGEDALGRDELWVVHQLNSPELPRDFETTVTGALSSFMLADEPGAGIVVSVESSVGEGTSTGDGGTDQVTPGLRLDLTDDSFSTPTNFPRAVALSPGGDKAYVVLAGSDTLMGIDLSEPAGPRLMGFWPVGSNPRGIALDASRERAYVMNYLSRDVSVLDLADAVSRPELVRIEVVEETLDPAIIEGKRFFNNASDARLSHLGWISCASCHPDGGADGTTWLTPDGPRQSMPLWGLSGTAPFHASATRDEVQDFEHDIEILMAGSGLAPGPPAPELGEPNGGRSTDLDELARYVLEGIRTPAAPPLDEAAVARGRVTFGSAGCASCHAGPSWTISELPAAAGETASVTGQVEQALRNVGTFRPESDVLGAIGFDVPTLLGLHASAPYLHDGSAQTLTELLQTPEHVRGTLSPGETDDLVSFLTSIDGRTAWFRD